MNKPPAVSAHGPQAPYVVSLLSNFRGRHVTKGLNLDKQMHATCTCTKCPPQAALAVAASCGVRVYARGTVCPRCLAPPLSVTWRP